MLGRRRRRAVRAPCAPPRARSKRDRSSSTSGRTCAAGQQRGRRPGLPSPSARQPRGASRGRRRPAPRLSCQGGQRGRAP
eukprot:7390993-Prymnesium_polylepis.2